MERDNARTLDGLTQLFQVEAADGSGSGRIAIGTNNNNNATGPGIYLFRSRTGSLNGNTLVNDNDDLGTIYFHGADGTDVNSRAATIRCEVDGTPGTNDMPGRLVFATTADGSALPTERMRIDSLGRVGIGCTPASGFQFKRGQNELSLQPTADTQTGYITFINTASSTKGAIEYNYASDYMAFNPPVPRAYVSTALGGCWWGRVVILQILEQSASASRRRWNNSCEK